MGMLSDVEVSCVTVFGVPSETVSGAIGIGEYVLAPADWWVA